MDGNTSGRANQRRRTRKDLLEAAARLLREGRTPSLEEVAEAALVSRATAYRYFPSMEALLREAALDVQTPDAETLFADDPETDPVARLEKVGEVLDRTLQANEAAFRMMLAHSMERVVRGETGKGEPVRQNRRTPLIEAALAPARDRLDPKTARLLAQALAVMIGTESMVVTKDVLQLSDAEARSLRRWAIRALVEAARRGA
ncbi:MAG: helix-turn-helix domain-containing protein [Phenylobacterium sp.]|jgi:AcrR family transcriptional regulator|uniref:TetR/AcrR family transcriptional regulator n=1 Tax=Phenylobacterium sp. TaxID=1871053 RepID=UPI002A2C628F|nr:helix-turn-helix domain-containing protein [Phenylobacterium sp.]MDD3838087.1 helix-turn-helix domain containing protein [Phenylobacterium sp.]MDX9998561.1 helix-turn-helix domain-containing protein [Phenylobacterium sp.]